MLIEQLNCFEIVLGLSDSVFLTIIRILIIISVFLTVFQQLYITQVSISPVNLTHHDIPTSSSTTQAE